MITAEIFINLLKKFIKLKYSSFPPVMRLMIGLFQRENNYLKKN